ncbi:kinetochore Sim4 complex subunit FTA2-domain-containing protein [Parachaetomium inaequale]|uniref:Kinetochore Sim4 complex subunit FTA2-domain-containing protein n=1 Tax=Parachaetomium inaequale TaxID=2588326 RepID=A0AAN6SM58_9PEZI|nr:kinetochore Sim4 complex subunit FTA2-domain-containing protein [Parachaetomium inaequale]
MVDYPDSADLLEPLPDPPEPLPLVIGPKLAPFTPMAHADIEFIKELGNPEQDLDSRVWEVKIDGAETHYALKIFYFNHYGYLSQSSGGYMSRRLASRQRYIDFFDPFNCECRVYGRLKQEEREDLAVRAHGYLLLTPEQEDELCRMIEGIDYDEPVDPDKNGNGTNTWGRWEQHHHLPLRAIVKDLATHPDPFKPAQITDMWKDLEELHGLGILVRDITVFNYYNAKLIDFSRAWTWPHPSLDAITSYHLKDQLQRDPGGLEDVIVEWGIDMRWNWDEVEISQDLQDCASGKGEGERGPFGVDPRLYDWRKWEEDLVAADEFMEHELYAEVEEAEDEWQS